MNDIAELERRIAYAMERIAKGVEALDRAAPAAAPHPVAAPQEAAPDTGVSADAGAEASAEIEALRAQLAEERLANAQLEERVRSIKHKQEARAAQAEADLAATRETLAQLDLELSRLRKANDQLQASNTALRAANESGVGEPHLINKAMMAELESLRAARQVDMAEAQAIKDSLKPLLDSKEEAN